MRWWVCGLLIAMACPAVAADYDDSWLRGSQVIGAAPTPPPRLYRIWAGVYGGAQVGEDFRGVDFRATQGIQTAINEDSVLNSLASALPNMQTLPQISTSGPSYGGFVGYNWQIDDVVFGAEFNANRSNLHQDANSNVSRSYIINSGGNLFAPTTVNVTAHSTIAMSDYFTFRGRLGWAFGNFLPYIVGGLSLAQVDSTRSVDINYFGTCVNTSSSICPIVGTGINAHNLTIGGDFPFSNVSHGKYIIGFDGAVGMDYLVTRYVFVRGEVEYVHLGNPNDIRLNAISARTAIGLRF
jgi:opacity protein-like surface antigen